MTCPPGRAAFVVLAGGSGTRLGAAGNKVYLPVAGRPLLSWSLRWADDVPAVGPVVLVVRAGDEAAAADAVAAAGLAREVEVVTGGRTRHGSELAALDLLAARIGAGELDVVAIHDGARPLAGAALLRDVLDAAADHGGAVPTVPAPQVWRHDPVTGGLSRAEVHAVQTPQGFRAAPLLAAYAASRAGDPDGTDTAGVVERHGDLRVRALPGSPDNLKVTFAADVPRAEALLAERVRTG